MSKRILSLVLAMVMVLGAFGTVFADTAEAIDPKVQWLIDQGLLQGDGSGNYDLDKAITRDVLARIVAVALQDEATAQSMKAAPSGFADMTPAHWANGYAAYANAKGYMVGNEKNQFMPAGTVNYDQALVVLTKIALGRDLTAEEKAGALKWYAPYVAKAAELGIMDGVSITNVSAPAVKEDILKMLYNVLNNKEYGNYNVVKAIVLENNRVEAIDKNEVVVEIIREVQRANYAEASRAYDKGDQENFIIDLKGEDVEDLLGKVADFSIDKNGKVVKVTIDSSYKVVEGPIYKATKNQIEMDRNYTVELDERYKGSDERIFRTYHNDKAYKYEDFYRDIKEADYARATIKNGKVLFINAFTFEDVAPVQETKRDGQDVYVYNDYRDARVEKFEPRSLVLGYNNGKLTRIERKDIKSNDVVHVYAKNRMIVRQDAAVEGTYQKVERDRDNNYFVHVEDSKYYVGNKDYFRPVYAHDSKAYTTLYTQYAQTDLANFYKEKVTILVDINGDLQLFGANVQYNEGMAMIEQILARGQVKFVQPNDERLILDEDYKSDISINIDGKTTTNQRLNAFNTRDLVFVLGAEDKIDTLVRIKTEAEMRLAKKELLSAKADDMNNSFIRLKDKARIQVLDRTNVFVINTKGEISATTVAKLQASLKVDSKVEAFILTDADVTQLVKDGTISDRNRITNESNIAHTVVFIDVDYKAAATDGETVLVTNVYTARAPHSVIGQRPGRVDERTVERTAATGVSLNNLKNNDIVSLKLSKDDDKLVKDFTVLIEGNKVDTDSYRVIGGDINYSNSEYRRLVLEDANGEKITKWLVRNAEEFGTITIDSVVTFYEDKNTDIDVIRVYSKNTKVTAKAFGADQNGLVKVLNSKPGFESIAIDGKTPYFLNARTILKDAKGNVIAMGADEVIKELKDGDKVEVSFAGDVMTITRLFTVTEMTAVNGATDKIVELPKLADIKITDKSAVEAARAAYNALSAEQKKLIPAATLKALEEAEAKIAELVKENPAPGVVSATAGGIKANDGKVTVSAIRSEESVGTVTVEFTEDVTITKVMVTDKDGKEVEKTTEVVKKFGNEGKSKDKKLTAEITSTFADVAKQGVKAVVTVKNANNVEATFTVELEIQEPVVVTVADLETKELGVEEDEFGFAIYLAFDKVIKAFPKATKESTLLVTLKNVAKPIELAYAKEGEVEYFGNPKVAGDFKIDDLKAAIVTVAK